MFCFRLSRKYFYLLWRQHDPPLRALAAGTGDVTSCSHGAFVSVTICFRLESQINEMFFESIFLYYHTALHVVCRHGRTHGHKGINVTQTRARERERSFCLSARLHHIQGRILEPRLKASSYWSVSSSITALHRTHKLPKQINHLSFLKTAEFVSRRREGVRPTFWHTLRGVGSCRTATASGNWQEESFPIINTQSLTSPNGNDTDHARRFWIIKDR